jgi:threonine dehydrogenase-like Zn-dependent dehydrogenase
MSQSPSEALTEPSEVMRVARAAVLVGFGERLETRSLPVPEHLEPGALLVRIECATVCGTDVHLWQGRLRPDLDLAGGYIPGHECAGRVLALAPGSGTDTLGQPLKGGDLVIWANESCGRCPACTLHGQPGLCPRRRGLMTMPSTKFPYLTGGFAELSYVLPRSERVRVPDGIPAHHAAAAGCAVRTVMHAFERLGPIHPGEDVLVQGSGPIGLFSVAAARAAGARNIVVIGGPATRLEIAEAWGADLVLPLSQPPAGRAAAIRRLNGAGPDVVIEASGSPEAFVEGLDLIRPAGRYVLAGAVGDDTATVSPGRIVGKHLTVLGTWSASARHYWRALEFLRDMDDVELLFGTTYDLDDATEALARMASGAETKPIIRGAT